MTVWREREREREREGVYGRVLVREGVTLTPTEELPG